MAFRFQNMLGGSGESPKNYSLYEEANSISEQERTKHFQRQFDYYIRDTRQIKKYLVEALMVTFDKQTISEMQLPIINIVPRVINRLSNAYLSPAERYIAVDKEEVDGVKTANEAQKKQAELYAEIIGNSNINMRVKFAYRLARLMDVCHVQPVWRGGRIEYDVYPSHLISVQTEPDNYLKPKAVLARFIKADDKGNDKLAYKYEDAEVRQVLDDNGDLAKTEPNPYKRLTFVPLRLRETENYWGEGDSELIHANENINVNLVNADDNFIMQSHGQAFAVNLGLKGNLKTGPRHVVEADNVSNEMATPSLQFVQPESTVDKAMEYIDWKIKEICIQRGLPPFSVSTENKAESGAAKAIDTQELMEIREDDITALIEFEHELFEATKAVWNYHNPGKKIEESSRFAVEFEDQETPVSELDDLKAKALKLKMGLWNPVEEFVDEDSGIDEAQALEMVKRNLGIRNELNDEFGIMQNLEKAFAEDNINQGMNNE